MTHAAVGIIDRTDLITLAILGEITDPSLHNGNVNWYTGIPKNR
jgi:hypothetical protein